MRVITWARNRLRCWQDGLLRLGFPLRFLLEERDLARKYIEPLLFRLSDERPLVNRKLRVVDERVCQVIILRPQILLLLLLLLEKNPSDKEKSRFPRAPVTHLLSPLLTIGAHAGLLRALTLALTFVL